MKYRSCLMQEYDESSVFGPFTIPAEINSDIPDANSAQFRDTREVCNWIIRCKEFYQSNERVPRLFQNQVTINAYEHDLATWVANMHQLKHQGALPKETSSMYVGLKYWLWNQQHYAFVREMDQWNDYYLRTMHDPMASSRSPSERQLARWATIVRHQHHAGKLSKERIQVCERVRYWSWDGRIASKYAQMWKEYVSLTKKMPSLVADRVQERIVAEWAQHVKFAHKNNCLSAHTFGICKNLHVYGWNWDDVSADPSAGSSKAADRPETSTTTEDATSLTTAAATMLPDQLRMHPEMTTASTDALSYMLVQDQHLTSVEDQLFASHYDSSLDHLELFLESANWNWSPLRLTKIYQ